MSARILAYLELGSRRLEEALADVANVARRVGVLVGGRWYPESTLQAALKVQAAGYPDPGETLTYPFRVDRPATVAAGGMSAPPGSR